MKRFVKKFKARILDEISIQYVVNSMEIKGRLILKKWIDEYKDIETQINYKYLIMQCLYLGKKKVLNKEITNLLIAKFNSFNQYKIPIN